MLVIDEIFHGIIVCGLGMDGLCFFGADGRMCFLDIAIKTQRAPTKKHII